MVTDKMLQQAAGEVELAMLNSLSAKDITPHQFSERFEKKMKKLINKVKHPIRYNLLRSAAAIILIIFTLFGTLVAFSPEVRASVINWVRSTFFEFSQYSSAGDNSNTNYEYHFSLVPEGYTELATIDADDGKTYIYAHEEGYTLQFSYVIGNLAHNFFLKTDSHDHFDGLVNGNKADIYIANSEDENSAIVWRDSETDILLCVSANVDKDTLIAFAESVTKTAKENS